MMHININTSSQDASYIINNSLGNMINIPCNPLSIYSSNFLTAELNHNQLLNKIQALENELYHTAKIIKEDQTSRIINLQVNYKKNIYGLHSTEKNRNKCSPTRKNT